MGEPSGISIGGFDDSEWSGTFDLGWSGENTRLIWRILWQEGSLPDPAGDDLYEDLNGNLVAKTDARFISNVTVSHSIGRLFQGAPEQTTIQLSIGNVFDRSLDILEHASSYRGIAELPGRTYTVSLQGNW